MLKSSLCDYRDACILVKGTITVSNTAAEGAAANNTKKKVIFKNYAKFTKCISEINNTNVYDAKDLDIMMATYNLIEYTASFNFRVKITGQTGNDGTKDVKIMVPLSFLSVFWRSLEMPLINCEVNLMLTLSENWVIISTNNAGQNATFAMTDTKLYVPVVTLSTQDNARLLQELKFGIKRVIN